MTTEAYRKIGLIGRVDPEGTMFDGQTVKTRTVWRMLRERYGEDRVVVVETLGYKKQPLRVWHEWRRCVAECDDIVVSLSHNGRRLFFPLLKRQAERHGKRVYHDLIGGWLVQDCGREPNLPAQLSSFEVNWVESADLVEGLKAFGVENAEFLPNFKQIDPLGSDELKIPSSTPRRLCTFSRVMEKKGILDAVSAVGRLNAEDGVGSWELDIYGPVEADFQRVLDEALAAEPAARYCGSVAPEESVDALRSYWALLFPTKWKPEGFPGTVIDALAAGVPVVAARWRYYEEMLVDGETGTSYELGGGVDGLVGAIRMLEAIEVEGRMMDVKRSCLNHARLYSPEELFGRICERIEGSWGGCA